MAAPDPKPWQWMIFFLPVLIGTVGGFFLGFFLGLFTRPLDPRDPKGIVSYTYESFFGRRTKSSSLPPPSNLFAMLGFAVGAIYSCILVMKQKWKPAETTEPGDSAKPGTGETHSPAPSLPVLQLNCENCPAYLRAHGLVDEEYVRVEPLGGGVSNQVLRVVTSCRSFVIKQSRPQLRTEAPWFSDLTRVYREQEVMEALAPLLPPGTVPEVLFVDRANYAFAMSHAPEGAKVWKQSLLEGSIDLEMGERAGRVLGRIHHVSAEARERFARFADPAVFIQLRLDPFYRCIQQRLPEVAEPVERLVQDMLRRQQALCHGDYTPKNMLVHEQGFMLVDYETAYFGDPAMDLGLFLAHLVLKTTRRPGQQEDYDLLTRGFWRGYRQERTGPADLEARAIAHLGACLLARIDGTSPVDYLNDEQRETVRRLGKRLLLEQTPTWAEAWALVRAN